MPKGSSSGAAVALWIPQIPIIWRPCTLGGSTMRQHSNGTRLTVWVQLGVQPRWTIPVTMYNSSSSSLMHHTCRIQCMRRFRQLLRKTPPQAVSRVGDRGAPRNTHPTCCSMPSTQVGISIPTPSSGIRLSHTSRLPCRLGQLVRFKMVQAIVLLQLLVGWIIMPNKVKISLSTITWPNITPSQTVTHIRASGRLMHLVTRCNLKVVSMVLIRTQMLRLSVPLKAIRVVLTQLKLLRITMVDTRA
uniref:Uncharacterized protein n=1 Tax=Arundo donax TaxID=35708 RepID=A0A0A9B7P2_ARUDO